MRISAASTAYQVPIDHDDMNAGQGHDNDRPEPENSKQAQSQDGHEQLVAFRSAADEGADAAARDPQSGRPSEAMAQAPMSPDRVATGAAYTVRPGDSMSTIAKAHGVSLRSLIAANPQVANPNRITVGQQLHLPAASAGNAGAPVVGNGQAASPDGTPMYSQTDPRWGRNVLGRQATIGASGCAMTATAMAISKITGRHIDPGQLDRYLDQHRGYSGDGMQWNVAAQAAGLQAVKSNWSLPAIDAQIDAGRPVVVGVDYKPGSRGGANGTDHWIAITGRGHENGRSVYYANDPATGRQTKLYEDHGQLKEFEGSAHHRGNPYRTTGLLWAFSGGGAAPSAAAAQAASR